MSESIVVPQSPATAQILSAVRQLIVAAGGVVAARGVIDSSLVEPLIGLFFIAAPIAWSQVVVRLRHKTLVKLAAQLPDSVATLK